MLPRRAVLGPPGPPLSPFDEPAPALPVLGRPLRERQEETLRALGLELASEPPRDEPWLWVGAAEWFTPELLRRFLEAAAERPGGARLRLRHPAFQAWTEPLQALPEPGLHELALLPAGAGPGALERVPPLELEPELPRVPVDVPPGFEDRLPAELPLGVEAVHRLDHWSHLLRINQLALAGLAEREHRELRSLPWWRRAWRLLRLLLRARSLEPTRIARAMSRYGPGCRVHPTAVVEFSEVGEGAVIGPFAVVRGSVLGPGVRVEEHARVNFCSIGEGARVGRGANLALSVLMEGAMVSAGSGFAASVFGRRSFVALGATVLDLPFDGAVRVGPPGERRDAGPFLGAAIGHGARVGAGVVLGYGSELPSGAAVVLDPARVYRGGARPGEPFRVG